MATEIRLQVGPFVSVRDQFLKTDIEIAAILEWFIADVVSEMPEGLTQAEQNQWKLDQANAEIVRHISWKANRNRWRARQEQRETEDRQAQEEGQL